MDLLQLSQVAIKAAYSAGKIITENLNKEIAVQQKEGGTSYASQVVTEVDKACEQALLFHLLPTCAEFDLALLSEETEDDGLRFEKDYFWCIDPLDGTLAFINNEPGFAVSIALVAKDGTPLIGVVYDPSKNMLYHAVKNQGAFKNNKLWQLNSPNNHLTYVTDRKLEDTAQASAIQELLYNKVIDLDLEGVTEMAGAGAVLNAIRVLENGPACMLKFPKKEPGGGSLWDYAATACIYQELKLPATNFSGGTLDLNKRNDTFMNHEGVFFGNFIL